MRRTMVLALAGAALLALAPAAPAQITAGGPKPLATGPTNWPGVTIDLMSVERKGSGPHRQVGGAGSTAAKTDDRAVPADRQAR